MEQENEIRVIDFMIPTRHVYPTLKAAKDIEADVIVEKEDIEYAGHKWRIAHLIGSNTTLFSLGYLTGQEVFNSISISPLKDAMEALQTKIDNVKNGKNESGN